MSRWASLKYTRERVNRAGRTLARADGPEAVPDEVYDVISNWRACHSWPLNTFKLWLLDKAEHVDSKSLVAQRLKRLSSITLKLRRFPGMRLSAMQDIAGCRAIVSSVGQVHELVRKYEGSDLKHRLVHKDDYIAEPRESGYRSVHLIYRYFSDRNQKYNGLKVEVQLRSRLQHAWATAVETVGSFTEQALKSSQGQREWLRFFELMGTEIAFRENTALVPNTPVSRSELRGELREHESFLGVVNHLQIYAAALSIQEEADELKDAKFFLLELDPVATRLQITGYKADELEKASSDYMAVERNAISHGRDAVLVSVDSFTALKQAYPNYYLDTHRFIQVVKSAIEGGGKQAASQAPRGQLRLGFGEGPAPSVT